MSPRLNGVRTLAARGWGEGRAMRSARAAVVLLGLTCGVAVAVTAAPAAAEAGDSSLEERNGALLAAVRSQRSEQIAGFFPRTGNWRYLHTAHHRGGDRRAVWEFPAAETLRAIRGPLNQSFDIRYEGQLIGTLSHQVMHRGTRWRRVRGNRFVPPGARPDAAIYVEWRREGATWAVSTIADESFPSGETPEWCC